MIRPEELAAMRKEQERLTLPDECRIERRVKGAYNATTFSKSDTVTVIYEGPCDLHQINDLRFQQDVRFGEADRAERRWALAIPVTETSVQENDVAVITKQRDPWAPRELNVTMVLGGNFGTRRILALKEIDR